MHARRLSVCLATMLSVTYAAATARAQWDEDFESYLPGTDLHGLNGWQGLDNNPAAGAQVSNAIVLEGNQSVLIAGSSDLLRRFTGASSGKWGFRIWQFIPPDYVAAGLPPDFGASFILLNTYNDFGPYGRSVQLGFDSTDGMIHCDCGSMTPVLRPYLVNQWVHIECVIDLANDLVEVYYNGEALSAHSWTGGPTGGGNGTLNIAAVELSANGSSPVFYDIGSLLPVYSPCPCLGDMDGDAKLNGQDITGFLGCFFAEPLAGAACQCADQNGDGFLTDTDVETFVHRLLYQIACYRDVRDEVPGAQSAPPDVQRSYDRINRTDFLMGDIPAQQFLNSTPTSLLPYTIGRLHLLAASGLATVDAPGVESALNDIATLSGPMTLRDILSMPPGSNPALRLRIRDLRSLGFHIPRLPATLQEAADFSAGYGLIANQAPLHSYFRNYYGIPPTFTAQERMTLRAAAVLGACDGTPAPPSTESPTIPKNNMCCQFNRFCIDRNDNFCIWKRHPTSSIGFCLAPFDKCP